MKSRIEDIELDVKAIAESDVIPENAAKYNRKMYLALIDQGFDEEQALAITIGKPINF